MRLPATFACVVAATVFSACSSSPGSVPGGPIIDGGTVGGGSVGADAGSFDGGNGGPDGGIGADAGSAGDAGLDGGAGPGADGGTVGQDGGPAADGGTNGGPDAGGDAGTASACPSSFDPMPQQGSAAPPVLTDPHPGDLVRPAWEIRPPAGYMLTFEGTVDTRGNLYWLEWKFTASGAAYQLASATIDGAIRYRAAGPTSGTPRRLLWVADTLVLLNVEGDRNRNVFAEGYSSATGALVWRRELLPLIQDWNRDAANNNHDAAFNGAVATGGAVILSLGTGYKVESGYLSLDAASGAVHWVARTSDKDTLNICSPPRLADDGTVVGSQRLRDDTALFRFAPLKPPDLFFAGPPNEVSTLLSAPGSVLILAASGPDSFAPARPEVRCQNSGALLARFDTDSFFLADSPGSAWLGQRSGALSRYDIRTGQLMARVAASPSSPLLTSRAGILWVEQAIAYPGGASSGRTQGPPTLHVLGPDGAEVRRRALPQEAEAYNGSHAASVGDRILLEGELLPSAGSSGVIRAFDLPGWSAGAIEP